VDNNILKVAIVQEKPGNSVKRSMSLGVSYVTQAKEMGADIVLFPEAWTGGYCPPLIETDDPFSAKHKNEIEKWLNTAVDVGGEYINAFRKIAKKFEIGVVATCLTKGETAPRNSAVVIGKNGEILMQYDKVHTCDFGMEALLESGTDFKVCDFCGIKLGVMTCWDREFPEPAHVLMLKGAEIILISNACSITGARIHQLSSRVYENMAGLAMANYPSEGWGRSCAFSPTKFDEAGNFCENMTFIADELSEDIFLVEFDIGKIRECRKNQIWNRASRKVRAYSAISSQVLLAEYNPEYPTEFEKIKQNLAKILGNLALDIEHVGSTSIEGMIGKPTIDIDVIIDESTSLSKVKLRLENAGYKYNGNFGVNGRDMFTYRLTHKFFDHHVYIREKSAAEAANHVIFRDFLRENKTEATKYASLKRRSAEKYKFNIGDYTVSKTEFVKRILNKAKNPDDKFADYRLSSDKDEMPVDQIKRLLDMSFWAKGKTAEAVAKYISNAKCFGIFNKNNLLVGFARVVTDFTAFYYVWDFVVDENYRSQGVGTKLLEFMVNYEGFKGLSGALCTSSKGFYERYGFKSRENVFMVRD
jgi:predicted amidohydrolase/GrpB-like predicted nucleotidyltransferase (UPF0157 family)/GNAT superfamily N-acetyltransferase